MKLITYLIIVLLCLTACNIQDSNEGVILQIYTAFPSLKSIFGPKEVSLSGQVFVVTKGRDNIKLALVEIRVIPERELIDFVKGKRQDALQQIDTLNSKLKILKNEEELLKKAVAVVTKNYESSVCYTKASYFFDESEVKLCESINKNSENARKLHSNKQMEIYTVNYQISSLNEAAYYFTSLPQSEWKSKTDADGKFTLTLPVGTYVVAAESTRKIVDSSESYYWLVVVDANTKNQQIMLSNDNFFETKCSECVKP